MKSSHAISAESVAKFKAYLESIDAFPSRNGKVHVTAVAEGAGLDRQILYKHPIIRELFEAAVVQKGPNAANPKCFDGNATIRISFTLVTTLDVDMESGCALWGGAVDDRGYGV
jgi:Family of unknown function (DUF6262)